MTQKPYEIYKKECVCVDWIQVAQDRDQRGVIVDTIIYIRTEEQVQNLFTSKIIVLFS